jgi:hypothetical protein
VDRYLGVFGVPRETKVRKLSKGQMVQLCLALGSDPEVLILDEPTSGLEPVARRAFLKVLVSDVSAEGRTVFSPTHLLPELVWHGPLDGVDPARVAIGVGPGGNLLRGVQKRAGQPGGCFSDRVPGLLCRPRLR